MAYITQYNFRRIFSEIRKNKAFNGKAVDGKIYPDIDFNFFNKVEKEELLQFKAFVEDPDFYIDHYFKVVEKGENSLFLNDDVKPAYHDFSSCERLHMDFEGLLVPEAIRAKGKDVVKEFRQFYKDNQVIFENKPEFFELRAYMRFKTRIKMEYVRKANSGVREMDNVNLDAIKEKILQIWKSMQSWLNEEPEQEMRNTLFYAFRLRTFLVTNNKYAGQPIQYNRTGYTDEQIYKFLRHLYDRYKRPIMELLKDYYMVSVNSEIQMNGSILDKLGFVHCSHCSEMELGPEYYDLRTLGLHVA